jgi:hypothetical protein
MDLFAVNWIGVFLAAFAGFVVGGIWYGPVMGKKWMGAVGLTEEQIKEGNMPLIYGGAFLFSLLASWTLAHTFQSYADVGADLSVVAKIMTAFGAALGFIVPAIGTNYLFSQKSKGLFFIDASYWLLFYIAMGTVHAYLPLGFRRHHRLFRHSWSGQSRPRHRLPQVAGTRLPRSRELCRRDRPANRARPS